MAAFSYQHHPFIYEPVILQNLHHKMFGFLDDLENPTSSSFSHPYYPPESLHHFPVDHAASLHESSCLENGEISIVDVSNNNNNEPSVTNNHGHSADSSSVFGYKLESRSTGGEQVIDHKAVKVIPMDEKRKRRDGSSSSMTTVQSKEAREVKGRMRKQKESIGVMEVDDEEKNKKKKKMSNKDDYKKDQKKVRDQDQRDPPTGYIHVRARRGQATDSHSLAERVRREKISERMKVLQALVPGCDKVSGKAHMLDEIINYVQFLQNQVEFLSMKLASVNPMFYDFGMDLDALMASPEMRLNGLVSSPLGPLMPNVQTCTNNVSDITTTTTTFPTSNSYPLDLDSPPSSSLLFQLGQRLNIRSQDYGQLLWDVDHQRQKLTNQSGFSNNLCSFH